ncbi:tetratricopeptide repeat protein [Rhodoferax sp.]|uniref:tetratricopeptide repeat protein n=1 Tax=Rhodoferax sp. TaxID=50421 RepID=UPI002ACDC29C|nr:tetratricopeptide repeat protein [Rhodoferax sp.]MDZ7922413.1 tetratricopeptide repeat protein [Rhodoferax sp.]
MSANNGDAGNAYALMLDAARKTNSEKLFERAVELALRARSADAALDAARAWQRALPASKEANRYVLQILIGLNRVSDTLEPLKRELAGSTGKERIAAISLLPRYFARVTDKTLAAQQVEQALAPDLGTKSTGPAAWAAVGMLRLGAANPAGAMEAAQRGAALDSQSDEVAILNLNLMEAKVAQAEPLLRKYLDGKPMPELRMAYGRKLIDSSRYAEALMQMQTLTQQSPAFADAWLLKDSLELQDKKLQDAEVSLKKYMQLSAPQDTASDDTETGRGMVQALLLLAQIAEQTQRPEEAGAYLARINSPQDALRVHTRRATLLAGQGKLEEARALIRTTPEAQADDVRAKLNAEVQLLRDFKQFSAAYQLLQEGVKRFPKDVGMTYDLAMLAEKLNKLPEMEQLLRQVIALQPDYHHAYNALGYSLADRNLRLPEARQLIVKALEFAPNDPFIVDSLAWVEYRSGNLAEAKRLLEQAYANRQDAEIAAHLGEVLWAMGLRDDATTLWRKALEANKDNDTLQETVRRLRGAL